MALGSIPEKMPDTRLHSFLLFRNILTYGKGLYKTLILHGFYSLQIGLKISIAVAVPGRGFAVVGVDAFVIGVADAVGLGSGGAFVAAVYGVAPIGIAG